MVGTTMLRRQKPSYRLSLRSLPIQRRLVGLAMLTSGTGTIAGCGVIFGSFAPGTYVGDLPCTLSVVDPFGEEGEQDFTTTITLTIDEESNFNVNGVELVVGAEVVRSTPTADLSYEVTKITCKWDVVTVEYAPRPTLVGITVEGELVETYRWDAGSIRAEGRTDLQVGDISGTSSFTGVCEGVLTAQ